MRVKVHVIVAAFVLVVIGCGDAFGAGFGLYEYGARGNALGGAMIGRADDPSALVYNPAGITQIDGEALMFGATFVMPTMDIVTDLLDGTSPRTGSVDNTWIPPHVYYTKQISDRLWWGLGTYSRFGLGTEFPAGWPGAANNYYAAIESLSINPNIAWKVNDKWSLAAGIEAMWFDFEQKRMYPSGEFRLHGDDWGWGWNVAAHYRPNDHWSLGLTYHGEVEQNVSGTAVFPTAAGAVSLPAHGTIELPQSVGAGISYSPNEWVSYEVDAIWTGWSSYDNLTIYSPGFGTEGKTSSEKEWEDVWRYQFGVEFQMKGDWQLRLGYVYDNSPVPDGTVDYMVPANDRQIYSIGAGWTRGDWTFDVSYSYLTIEDRTIAGNLAEGVYPSRFENGDSDLIGFSVTYRF